MSDHVDKSVLDRYDVGAKLGKGAYGVVWQAVDKRTGDVVALKKIFDAFQNDTDAQRTFREVMFLQEFSSHDNVIRILDVMKADNDMDLYLVFDYMETDLHAVIHAKILQTIHYQFIVFQIVRCLKYLHSGNVIHRDLKPSNVLLNAECVCRVADFGLARSLAAGETSRTVLTDYVATRWYRAPEILLGSKIYTKGVDMWSLGCILGEMLLGKPLFAGTSTEDQIERVLEIIGKPTQLELDTFCSLPAKRMIAKILPQRRRLLSDILPNAPAEAIDFMNKLFVFNPRNRMSAEDALNHPFISQFRVVGSTEPVIGHDVVIALDDNVRLTNTAYRSAIYDVMKKQAILQEERLRQRLAEVNLGPKPIIGTSLSSLGHSHTNSLAEIGGREHVDGQRRTAIGNKSATQSKQSLGDMVVAVDPSAVRRTVAASSDLEAVASPSSPTPATKKSINPSAVAPEPVLPISARQNSRQAPSLAAAAGKPTTVSAKPETMQSPPANSHNTAASNAASTPSQKNQPLISTPWATGF